MLCSFTGRLTFHSADPTYAEAVAQFGYSDDWEKYTLCEFIYSQFALFAMSPCVLINVLDPAKHKETVALKLYEIQDDTVWTAFCAFTSTSRRLPQHDKLRAFWNLTRRISIRYLRRGVRRRDYG